MFGVVELRWAYWSGVGFDGRVRLEEYSLAHLLVALALVLQLFAFRVMWRHVATLVICSVFFIVSFGIFVGVF